MSLTAWGLLVLPLAPVPAVLWRSWLSEPILSVVHLLAGLALILAVTMALAGWWRRGLLAILLAGLNLTLMLRPVGAGDVWAGDAWVMSGASSAMAAQASRCAHPIRIATLNVAWDNNRPGVIADYLQSKPFDYVFLQEVRVSRWVSWRAMLDRLRATYPYQLVRDTPDVAILSRSPLDTVSGYPVSDYKGSGRMVSDSSDGTVAARLRAALSSSVSASATFHAVTRIEGRDVALIAAHLSSPRSQARFETRNRQLTLLARGMMDLADIPVILGGDLNGVRWNPHITHFLHKAGLRFLKHGFPPPATRPNWLPVLGVQIDYVAPTRWAFTGTQAAGPDVGSDHLPLEAVLCPTWTAESASGPGRSPIQP